MLNQMFSAKSESTTSSASQLDKTAQLTALASMIANRVIKAVEEREDELIGLLVKSKASHDDMDLLIAKTVDLNSFDSAFLTTVPADELEKMIKSQQSKRSRLKGIVMTMENYRHMMTGAVAENLLRIATGKPKSNGGGTSKQSLEYDDKTIDLYRSDLEACKRELRNVQSKKSIMKSKFDYNEQDPRWNQLLEAEALLKSIRDGQTSVMVVDNRIDDIKQLFGAAGDYTGWSAKQVKELLTAIAVAING